MEILPAGTPPGEVEAVMEVLSHVHVGSDDDITDAQTQAEYDAGAELTRSQLLSCSLSLQIAADGCVDRLLKVWRSVVQRVYNYYQLSAKSYFTFLQLSAQVDLSIIDVKFKSDHVLSISDAKENQ